VTAKANASADQHAPASAFVPKAVDKPLLARLSISLFATVMGLGGLGNAWAAAAHLFGAPAIIGQVLLALAGMIFAILVIVHTAKLALQPGAVYEEFRHPVRASFFPTVSVAAIVLSIGVRPYALGLAEALWWAGAVVHLALALTLIRRWIVEAQDEAVLTPAWFIPVVGNILVPLGGVPLGHVEISFFFFAIGLVLWIVFFTIVMHRVLFMAPMSERSVPTLFILLAPPSIGLASYLALTGGEVGWLAHILYSLALFIALLLLMLANHFKRGAFFMSWWAMTFPADGFAGATLSYAYARPSAFTLAVAYLALAAATLIVIIVAWRTSQAIMNGAAFRED
jgi:tellurite resistance protein